MDGLNIFDNSGLVSVGYLNMSEEYNVTGLPRWAFKVWITLSLDDEHKFWKKEILPGPI